MGGAYIRDGQPVAECHYCGLELDLNNPTVLQRVVGWQKIAGIRASGKHGGSDIRLRQTRDDWAHAHCVDRQRSGVAVGQEALEV